MLVCLPNDHTSGTKAGCPTPAAMVADNDLALGRLVEGLSHSRFWKEMALVAIEDDPQDGWDHVSGYRTTAYVVSPFARRNAVISTHYSTVSILRTIEQILGLKPLNQFDAAARPMFECFTETPDFTPFDALPSNVPLDQMNPEAARHRQSAVAGRCPGFRANQLRPGRSGPGRSAQPHLVAGHARTRRTLSGVGRQQRRRRLIGTSGSCTLVPSPGGRGDRAILPELEVMQLLLLAMCTAVLPPDIPQLSWQERSDWINVRRHVTPPAVGDGQADDTAAIQAALDRPGDGQTVYLPPGTYRITRTLVFRGPRHGCLVVGHGRDTRLVWDGPAGGRMFWSNGVAYSRYVGLSWDGRGRAAVGFDHAAQQRFETEVRHEHEAFRNFTAFGIRVGHEQKVASAEILYHNCLFENCGTALAFLTFNDYDNTIDGCEFRNCGTGVLDNKGNFYARSCHFDGSRRADFVVGSEHGSSIRRCTSVGSRRFIDEPGTIAPLTVQDCHVAAWTDPAGAVHLSGSPVLMFDCTFTRPPSDRPPVRLANPAQKLMLCNNRPAAIEGLVQAAPAAKLYVIPPGRLGGVIASAEQRFLHDSAPVPGRVFDAVRDFGAKADGKSDDTAAIQAAIDAAGRAGRRSVAYLPTGRYVVSKTLLVTGRDYTLGGSGYRCGLLWRSAPGRPLIEVSGVRNVTLANLAVGNHDFGPMNHGDDIHVISNLGTPCRLTLDEVSAFGMYQKAPDEHGLHFDQLPPGSVVEAIHVQGNLRITGSDRALFLFRTSYEGTVTIRGPAASGTVPIFVAGGHKNGTVPFGITVDTKTCTASAAPEGFLGFLTRLATQSKPTLRVCDNRSIVMSDFYNEQSDQHMVFEGAAGQPEGSVTIQGPKMYMFTQEPVIDIRDYAGRIYYGQSQFYTEPKEPRFVSHGTRLVRLILAGHFWYNTKPRFELGPEVKLTLVANREVPDRGVDDEALKAISAALDDLRRLGELDLRLRDAP